MSTKKSVELSDHLDELVMSAGEFLHGLRKLFSAPRHPQIKADLYNLMLAYENAPRWRKYICTRELKEDLSERRRENERHH